MAGNPVSRAWKMEAPIVGMALNRRGDFLSLALGDGKIIVFEASDLVEDRIVVEAHNGVSLSLQPDSDEHAFLTGGDDGAVMIIEPTGGDPVPVTSQKNKWIDQVASSSQGHRAYACGKQVYLLNEEGAQIGEPLTFPSSIGSLSFSPNGKRLAVSHYNGVSLLWVNAKEKEIQLLPWKGSHLDLIWTPDGKMLLSSMQEGALHGWDLSDPTDMREMQMQGYATKIRSMGFTAQGKYLATSGTDQVICWPFFGGGPWGKKPMTLGGSDGRLVSCVAPHPRDPVVAAGYEDGMVILAPLDGRMEIMIFPPDSTPGNNVVGMAWNAAGDSLFVAQENGTVMLFTLASVRRGTVGR